MRLPHLSGEKKRALLITAGVLGGVAALGAGAYAVYHSERMRMLRATRRAGQWMQRIGGALQTLSTVVQA